MNFLNAWVLFFLPLTFIPFIFFQSSNNNYSWNDMVPLDLLSIIVGILLKVLSSLIIALLILVLAQPFSDQKVIDKVGEGAQIGLVLDRSASIVKKRVKQNQLLQVVLLLIFLSLEPTIWLE